MPETWVDQATARFGEPHIALAEPVNLGDKIRRCWVWFVDGQNFNVSIDQMPTGPRYCTTAGAPGRHAFFWSEGVPPDAEVRALLTFCWPGFAEVPRCVGPR